jgi:hypothetical protein
MKHYKFIPEAALIFAMALLVQTICVSSIQADTLSNHVYAKVQSLCLKEYDIYGDKINEETGALFGIGYKSIPSMDTDSFSGGGEVFFGEVETNVSSENNATYENKNKYAGLNLNGNMNFVLFDSFLKDQSLMATGGLGLDCWIRTIGLANYKNAYREIWTNFYGRAGLGFYLLQNVYITGGVKWPFWTQRHIGDFGININPGGKLGYFLEPTIVFKHLSLDLFYESNKFGDDVSTRKSGRLSGWQPASIGRSFGFSVRSNF